MNFPFFMEGVKIVPGLSHGLGNAANSADRVSLENYKRVAILVSQYQAGADADTLTWHKATAASAGTEDTTNPITNYWTLEDCTPGTTADTWTKGTAVASGSTLATSAGASGTSYYLIDIGADELPDSTADYKFVELVTGGAGAVGNFLNVIYFLYQPRYSQATLPTAQA